jgi:hypothetical protein
MFLECMCLLSECILENLLEFISLGIPHDDFLKLTIYGEVLSLGILEGDHCRNRHDTKLLGNLREFIGVYLQEGDVLFLFFDILDDPAHHSAWSTPGCVEVDKDILVFLDDIHEIF